MKGSTFFFSVFVVWLCISCNNPNNKYKAQQGKRSYDSLVKPITPEIQDTVKYNKIYLYCWCYNFERSATDLTHVCETPVNVNPASIMGKQYLHDSITRTGDIDTLQKYFFKNYLSKQDFSRPIDTRVVFLLVRASSGIEDTLAFFGDSIAFFNSNEMYTYKHKVAYYLKKTEFGKTMKPLCND